MPDQDNNGDFYGDLEVYPDDGTSPLMSGVTIRNFAKNSARIEKGHHTWLDTVENIVDAGDFYIEIYGLASMTGAQAYNKALSERRAKAAEMYLKIMDVPDSKIHVSVGLGWDSLGPASKPGVENGYDRRVHIYIWKVPARTLTKNFRKTSVNRVRMTFA